MTDTTQMSPPQQPHSITQFPQALTSQALPTLAYLKVIQHLFPGQEQQGLLPYLFGNL